jgi:hypothetical protein
MKHVSAIFAVLLTAGCAGIGVPGALAPAANEALAITVAAKGVQIYECGPAKSRTGHEWIFIAPDAELFDHRGRAIGVHGWRTVLAGQ